MRVRLLATIACLALLASPAWAQPEGAVEAIIIVTGGPPGSSCPPPGSTPGCTSTTTVVERSITLTDLTPEFALTGIPGDTLQQEGVVMMTVTSNSR
ncbi:hypothetical protein [Plantactinospora sp. B5E13]|uniref:hypothetical protein n=1 Tax=unclassified Plantactinospora TaxID=2631981 RepID=UPI00325D33C9